MCIRSLLYVVSPADPLLDKLLLGLCGSNHTLLQGFCGYPAGVETGKYGLGYFPQAAPGLMGMNPGPPLIAFFPSCQPSLPLVPRRCDREKLPISHVARLPRSLLGIALPIRSGRGNIPPICHGSPPICRGCPPMSRLSSRPATYPPAPRRTSG